MIWLIMAFLGLLNAIERFDVERGVKFETYAATRIRGSILDAIRAARLDTDLTAAKGKSL